MDITTNGKNFPIASYGYNHEREKFSHCCDFLTLPHQTVLMNPAENPAENLKSICGRVQSLDKLRLVQVLVVNRVYVDFSSKHIEPQEFAENLTVKPEHIYIIMQ